MKNLQEIGKKKWVKPELTVICEIVVNEDILGSGNPNFNPDDPNDPWRPPTGN